MRQVIRVNRTETEDKGERNPMVRENIQPGGAAVEVASLLASVWKHRKWVAGCTIVLTALGVLRAMTARPVYTSQAIIALKESAKGGDASRFFSQFGGMGGVVASQLGLGNTNLDKIEILLKSHELSETVISEHNLMPLLFPMKWDAEKNAWKGNSSKIPTLRDGVRRLRQDCLSVSLDGKKGVIKVGANFRDPVMAKKLVDYYLIALNNRIRQNVIRDAETNRDYLEKQVASTLDPILREKIHTMIGFEIEKAMLVSSQAFEILERPVVSIERARPKKKQIVVLSFLAGLFLSFLAIFTGNVIRVLKKTGSPSQ